MFEIRLAYSAGVFFIKALLFPKVSMLSIEYMCEAEVK